MVVGGVTSLQLLGMDLDLIRIESDRNVTIYHILI
jgi:hypothetical protein